MKPRQSVTHVPLSRIDTHPGNVREDLGDLTELASSIREHGILQPLVVTDDFGDRFLLLGGHRRAAAARQAGLTEVPVVIRHGLSTDDAEQLIVMLVENCQRAELNPIEKAEALGELRERGLSQADIARRTGLRLASVSRFLGMLKLPLSERQAIKAGHRSAEAALTVAREQRQEERVRAAGRPVGRPKGRTTTPYFSLAHPLANAAAAYCSAASRLRTRRSWSCPPSRSAPRRRRTPTWPRATHKTGRVKVGGVACGPCWEAVIRTDALNPTTEQEQTA